MSILGRIRAHGCRVETTPARAITALALGSVVGAGLVATPIAISITVNNGLAGGLVGFALSFAVALSAFAAGLVAVTPLWWGLHRVGVRSWWVAAPVGALFCGAPVLLLSGSLFIATGFALAGAIVGAVVWKVAYRHIGVGENA